jgi:hypothetical protein
VHTTSAPTAILVSVVAGPVPNRTSRVGGPRMILAEAFVVAASVSGERAKGSINRNFDAQRVFSDRMGTSCTN